jgi:hypothetical protein
VTLMRRIVEKTRGLEAGENPLFGDSRPAAKPSPLY